VTFGLIDVNPRNETGDIGTPEGLIRKKETGLTQKKRFKDKGKEKNNQHKKPQSIKFWKELTEPTQKEQPSGPGRKLGSRALPW